MTLSSPSPRRDHHAEVTGKIIAAIEAGADRPQMPWRRSGAPLWLPENAGSRKPYSGINIVSLWVAAEARGFTAPIWATYRQWQDLGAQVRKGARSEIVIFYREYDSEPDPEVADDDGKRRVARASAVFNAAEVDGFALPAAPERLGPIDRIAAADRFVAATGARIVAGGERACYRPASDQIDMPDEGLFCGTDTMDRRESWYAVLLHELTHWTGAKGRCDRDFGARFGKAERAAEELVAEIGAAILCAELGITQDTRPDHAAYVANWLTLLKSDSRAIFTAAAKASQAVTFLKTLQPVEA